MTTGPMCRLYKQEIWANAHGTRESPQAVTHRSTNRARRRVSSFQPKRVINYATPPGEQP